LEQLLSARQSTPSHTRRLKIDPKGSTITFDGTQFKVNQDGAEFVDALAREKGWIAEPAIKRIYYPDLDRIERVRDKLPAPIRALIESKRGAGYRLKPEALE